MSPAFRQRFLGPGDKLGKYELIRPLAMGGMAEIHLAWTLGIEGFEKLVVVKRILPQYRDNEKFVNMFLQEARLVATLHHPNIAQVYDVGQEEADYFFAMEYVHGEDLTKVIQAAMEKGVVFPLDAALTLVAGMCAGLQYAHSKVGSDGRPLNIVHRDVSPGNVLVSYDGSVKLVDFGIARAAGSAPAATNNLRGKVAYMSPEQCRSSTSVDKRSDIYALGTILYELTTGRMPFSDETEYALMNQIVNQDVPPPSLLVPNYPPALETIVMRAIARNPDHRYRTALELHGALEEFAVEHRVRVSPLVLGELMTTLFPNRLTEHDHARAQDAFYVEHQVRASTEGGGSGGGLPSGGISNKRAPSAFAQPIFDDDDYDNSEDTVVSSAFEAMLSGDKITGDESMGGDTILGVAPIDLNKVDDLAPPPRPSQPLPRSSQPPPRPSQPRHTPHPIEMAQAQQSYQQQQPRFDIRQSSPNYGAPQRATPMPMQVPGEVPIMDQYGRPSDPQIASGTLEPNRYSYPPQPSSVVISPMLDERAPAVPMKGDTSRVAGGRSKTPFIALGVAGLIGAVVTVVILIGSDKSTPAAAAPKTDPAIATGSDKGDAKPNPLDVKPDVKDVKPDVKPGSAATPPVGSGSATTAGSADPKTPDPKAGSGSAGSAAVVEAGSAKPDVGSGSAAVAAGSGSAKPVIKKPFVPKQPKQPKEPKGSGDSGSGDDDSLFLPVRPGDKKK